MRNKKTSPRIYGEVFYFLRSPGPTQPPSADSTCLARLLTGGGQVKAAPAALDSLEGKQLSQDEAPPANTAGVVKRQIDVLQQLHT